MRWWWLLALSLALLQLWFPPPQSVGVRGDKMPELSEQSALEQRLVMVAAPGPYQQRGAMLSPEGEALLDADELEQLTRHEPGRGSLVWQDEEQQPLLMAAPHSSNHYYFANSYLVGFAPWLDAPLWQPLQVATLRKRYRLDDLSYDGRLEVWQNSAEAFANLWGDCEDHALFIADWLIALGYDARVAVGTAEGEGHAWVVVKVGALDYLIEATNKSWLSGANPYPPAITQRSYQADYQFNRQQFWVRQRPGYSYDRDGREWRLASRFLPQSSD